MNRELKFRVWNGMEMIHDVTVGKFGAFYVNPGDKGNGLDPNDSASLTPFTTKYADETPVMQYTGFKDKNGTEIYEGDILSCRVFIDGKWEDSKEPVIFRDGCFALDWSFQKDGSYYEILSKEIEGKVILGNIYQNANLLPSAVAV